MLQATAAAGTREASAGTDSARRAVPQRQNGAAVKFQRGVLMVMHHATTSCWRRCHHRVVSPRHTPTAFWIITPRLRRCCGPATSRRGRTPLEISTRFGPVKPRPLRGSGYCLGGGLRARELLLCHATTPARLPRACCGSVHHAHPRAAARQEEEGGEELRGTLARCRMSHSLCVRACVRSLSRPPAVCLCPFPYSLSPLPLSVSYFILLLFLVLPFLLSHSLAPGL